MPGDLFDCQKAGISGLFSGLFGNTVERRTGWLGREGSNLRMAESKSGRTLSNFNARSEFRR